MHSIENWNYKPQKLDDLLNDTKSLGFNMVSEPKVGMLLRFLAASKPNGQFLELGTGTGYGTAWILDGMDRTSTLDSVDNNPAALQIARNHLGNDPRLTFFIEDGNDYLNRMTEEKYDLIFADAYPGKYENLHLSLGLLKKGGILVLDDMLPQPNWPENHEPKVLALLAHFETLENYKVVKMDWATGLVLVVRSNL